MSNKKEQERSELHKTIWQIANDLRGSIDGWDFKQYVLGMMFYRFISENITQYIDKNEHEDGNTSFSYEKLDDATAEFARHQVVDEKGFFILPSELFVNVTKKAESDDNLNTTLERIFKDIEGSANGTPSEDNLKGLFDDIDVNSNKLGRTVNEKNKLLRKLMFSINDLKIGKYEDNTIDAFGDAYEYLMGMYAANAGRSGGEFFTPQEVSELLTRLALIDFSSKEVVDGKTIIKDKASVEKVYDPACGSGSLLLNFAKILGKDNVKQGFYGQELNLTTYNLARINMFLHDINFERFYFSQGNTLTDPAHWDDKPFDVIVSNPPYSKSWEGDTNPLLINDPRFAPAGVLAPKAKSDFAFVMHILSWLSSSGTAAIVEFPGTMSRPGAEQKIRKYLVDNNFIDSIIQLPADLFFGTPISTIIIVLRKNKTENKIHFIDASKEFVRFDTKNKLNNENIQHILESVRYKSEEDHFSVYVDNMDIVTNEYNLSVNTYLTPENTQEVVDIVKLNQEIKEIVSKVDTLRKSIGDIIADLEGDDEMSFQTLVIEKKKVYLSEYFKYYRGKRLKKSDRVTGEIPLVTAGYQNEGIASYISNASDVFENAITIDMFGNCFWRAYKFACDDNIIVLNQENLNIETAHYFLSAVKKYVGKFHYNNQYRLEDLRKHVMDIPVKNQSIDYQIIKNISGILSKVAELEAELEAEIAARRKQYEYYRNKLLTF